MNDWKGSKYFKTKLKIVGFSNNVMVFNAKNHKSWLRKCSFQYMFYWTEINDMHKVIIKVM